MAGVELRKGVCASAGAFLQMPSARFRQGHITTVGVPRDSIRKHLIAVDISGTSSLYTLIPVEPQLEMRKNKRTKSSDLRHGVEQFQTWGRATSDMGNVHP